MSVCLNSFFSLLLFTLMFLSVICHIQPGPRRLQPAVDSEYVCVSLYVCSRKSLIDDDCQKKPHAMSLIV